MSLPTYVTVPFERTITFASSSGPSATRLPPQPSPRFAKRSPGRPVPLASPSSPCSSPPSRNTAHPSPSAAQTRGPRSAGGESRSPAAESRIRSPAAASSPDAAAAPPSTPAPRSAPSHCRRLDRVQRVAAAAFFWPQLRRLRVVPLRNPRIQIPAVVVDALASSASSAISASHASQVQRLQMREPHHHIGHLHAGVVDVVLHVHLLPGRAQQPHKGVAQDRVAQVPDVRGLVGIDAGVLDQSVQFFRRRQSISRPRNSLRDPPRSSRALMYPAPATSKPANPGTLPAPQQSPRQSSSEPCAACAPAQRRSASRTRRTSAPAAAPAPLHRLRSHTNRRAPGESARPIASALSDTRQTHPPVARKSLILAAPTQHPAGQTLAPRPSFKMRTVPASFSAVRF